MNAFSDTYLSVRQLAERFGVSKATVWRWAATGNIPQPVKLSAGVTRWRASDLEVALAEK